LLATVNRRIFQPLQNYYNDVKREGSLKRRALDDDYGEEAREGTRKRVMIKAPSGNATAVSSSFHNRMLASPNIRLLISPLLGPRMASLI
jgi:hypothetical protein